MSPEKTAHLLATVPAGERPLLYAVVDGCVRDYHYTWTHWPLSVLAAWDIRSKKKPFGLSSLASFSLSGETQPRSRRGIVLVH
jgi:hypothetical protein